MDFKKKFELFLSDYFAIVSRVDEKLIRADVFTDFENNYHIAFIAEGDGKQVLLGGRGEELYVADEIIPLFVQAQDEVILDAIKDFYVRVPSDTVLSEPMALTLRSMSDLSYPSAALTPSYLIRHDSMFGIISADGNYLIEPEYAQIRALPASSEYQYLSDPHEPAMGRTIGEAVCFVCTRSFAQENGVDVYAVTGECVFCDLEAFYPYQRMITTPEIPMDIKFALPRYEDILSYYAVTRCSTGDLQWNFYQTETLFKNPGFGEIRLAPLVKQAPWKHVNLKYLSENELTSLLLFLRPMANLVGAKLGVTGSEVISNMAVYTHFRKINEPIAADLFDEKLAEVFGDMTIRSYNTLRRLGVHTVRDLHKFPNEKILRIKSQVASIEICCIKRRIQNIFSEGVIK